MRRLDGEFSIDCLKHFELRETRSFSSKVLIAPGKKISTKGYTNVYPLDTLMLMKDAGLRIRVQRELRENFLEACRVEDKPAAQVIREFMREYVRQHQEQQTGLSVPKDPGEQTKI